MRRWLLPFQGYRVVVTEPDGSQRWASMPREGSNLFTEDHRSSGTSGGLWRAKRVPHTPQDFSEVGYNQVCSHHDTDVTVVMPPMHRLQNIALSKHLLGVLWPFKQGRRMVGNTNL